MYNNVTALYNLNNKSSAVTENAAQFHRSQNFHCRMQIPLFNAVFLSNFGEYHKPYNAEK